MGGMFLFSGRKTVGAYRIRPDVREVFAALLGDAVVWFVLFAHVRAYAIRPYSFWLIAWGGAVLIFGLRGDFVGVFLFLFEGCFA